MIAFAESLRSGVLRMGHGSLEDAPVVPRTYRFLLNLGGFDVVNVLAVTSAAFKQPLDRVEHRFFPVSRVKLTVSTTELGVPELERGENVLRLRKSLRASEDTPLIFFLVVNNNMVTRLYPFFVNPD